MAWTYVESPSSTLSLDLTAPAAPVAHYVSRHTLTQDYPAGGRRCINVELFVRALRMRVVRGLFEPGPHPYRLLPFHWIQTSYPSFPHHPSALLLSNCDFSRLAPSVPLFWCEVLRSWGNLPHGLHPFSPLPKLSAPLPDPNANLQPAAKQRPPPPQPTYQMTRPLPPFDDGLWHRGPTRRDGYSQPIHLSVLLSLPLAHNPRLAGCLGAPVRDPASVSLPPILRDRATVCRLLRPRSAHCETASNELHHRLSRLAERGLTHILHLVSPPTASHPLRLRSAAELSQVGSVGRADTIPRWMCDELHASLPVAAQNTIAEAACLSLAFPDLTLLDLCRVLPLETGTWVLLVHPACPTNLVFKISTVSVGTPPDSPTYTLTNPMSIRPDGRLSPHDPSIALPAADGQITADFLRAVLVWPVTRLAHCEEHRAFDDRNPGAVPVVWLYGGPAVDRGLLFAEPDSPVPHADPSALSLSFPVSDQALEPLHVPTLDVFSLYHLQLAFQFAPPRTLDPSRDPSETSTSHAHLLQPMSTLGAVRASMCKASHPSPAVGFPAAHALYLTLQDARPLGNERCRKHGPTRTLCDICWHACRLSNRELSSHALVDCPYSRLVIDPILRQLLACYSADASARAGWLTCVCSDLVDACRRMLVSGSSVGCPVSVPAPVAAAVAGSISIVLSARAFANAPRRVNPNVALRAQPPERPLAFSPTRPYHSIVRHILECRDNARRHATELDDRLIVLHPGIEKWLTEHGHVATWEKHWLPLSLAADIDTAPVGPTGSLGVSHLCLRVLPRLSLCPVLAPPPGCPGIRVRLTLSVGRLVGSLASPADPAADSWPLPADAAPEYAVDRIIDQRDHPRHGRQYLVRWLHRDNQGTWEPAAHMANTTALLTWTLRPRGIFTCVVHGLLPRLISLMSLPRLHPSRSRNLLNLRRAMDDDGVLALRPVRPNSVGAIVGGRTTFFDTRGVGNVLQTCHAPTRAFVFGALWDEIDISRSHFSSVCGSWSLTRRPRTVSHMRFNHDRVQLEAEIESELANALPACRRELASCLAATAVLPSPERARRVAIARKAVAKCGMKAKHVMSAMINVGHPDAWRIPFEHCLTLRQLLDDTLLMRPSVLLHPMCAPLAAALAQNGTPQRRAISICCGHLDDCALSAAATALLAADCVTGPTINDSLLVLANGPLTPDVLTFTADSAASASLRFPVFFSHLPGLTKPTDPAPTLDTLALVLQTAPPSPTSSMASSPACSPIPSRSASPHLQHSDADLPDDLPSASVSHHSPLSLPSRTPSPLRQQLLPAAPRSPSPPPMAPPQAPHPLPALPPSLLSSPLSAARVTTTFLSRDTPGPWPPGQPSFLRSPPPRARPQTALPPPLRAPQLGLLAMLPLPAPLHHRTSCMPRLLVRPFGRDGGLLTTYESDDCTDPPAAMPVPSQSLLPPCRPRPPPPLCPPLPPFALRLPPTPLAPGLPPTPLPRPCPLVRPRPLRALARRVQHRFFSPYLSSLHLTSRPSPARSRPPASLPPLMPLPYLRPPPYSGCPPPPSPIPAFALSFARAAPPLVALPAPELRSRQAMIEPCAPSPCYPQTHTDPAHHTALTAHAAHVHPPRSLAAMIGDGILLLLKRATQTWWP